MVCATKDWSWHEGNPAIWSEPIFACGAEAVVKGDAPHTDARKFALTDGLTKAALVLGVGHTVFFGAKMTIANLPGTKPTPPFSERCSIVRRNLLVSHSRRHKP